jgi:O-antigen ligase
MGEMNSGILIAWAPRIGAVAALGMLCAALTVGGADNAPLAALLGCALSFLLAMEIVALPQDRLNEVLRANAVSIAAGLVFFAWGLATAAVLPANVAPDWLKSLWHPTWRQFGSTGGAISMAPFRTLEGLAAFAAPAAAFFLGALNTVDRKDRDQTGRLFALAAVALTVFALSTLAQGGVSGRLTGGFNSPNAAATLFGVLALFLCAMVLRGARGRLSGVFGKSRPSSSHWLAMLQTAPISLAALILCLACLLLTGSRAGLVALAFGFVTLLALILAGMRGSSAPSRTFDGAFVVFVALAAIAGFFVVLGADLLVSRLSTLEGDAYDRQQMITAHWHAFLERPLIGHGLNSFHDINAHIANENNFTALANIGAAHNVFVQLLEETGVLGALLFLMMLTPPLWRTLRIAVSGRTGAEWAAASFAALVFALVHGMVDFGLQVPAITALLAYGIGAFSGSSGAHAALEPKAWEKVEPELAEEPRLDARHESDALARQERIEREREERALRLARERAAREERRAHARELREERDALRQADREARLAAAAAAPAGQPAPETQMDAGLLTWARGLVARKPKERVRPVLQFRALEEPGAMSSKPQRDS